MKRLNNHGWGLSDLIILLVVLAIFLIIFFVISYNYGIEEDSPTHLYEEFLP